MILKKIGLLSFAFLTVLTAQAQDRLVAVDSNNNYYSINRFTGAKTLLGAAVGGGLVTPAALAYDRKTGTLYCSDTATESLYTLDPVTGAAVLVGPFALPVGTNMHGLEHDDSTGKLYGTDWSSLRLYEIDKSTGAASSIGPVGAAGLCHIFYDSRKDELYAMSTVNNLYRMNRANAAVTFIGPTVNTGVPTGSAFDWSTGLMYTIDNVKDELYVVDLASGKCALVGSTGPGNLLGLAFIKDRGTMWAIDSSRAMFTVNTETGAKAAAVVANAAAGTTGGLAYDRHDNIVYLTSTSNDSLYRLDLTTGNVALIGPYGNAAIVMHGLEFDEFTRSLFGYSSHNNGLYRINTTTGNAALVGTTGLTSFGNLGYNSFTDQMYASNSNTDSFYEISRFTGAVSLLGPLVGPTNPNGLAFSYGDGKMYLVDNSTDNFYSIDLTTGVSTNIGPMGAGNLLGLAYVNPTPGNTVNLVVNFGQLGPTPYYAGPLPTVIPVSWRDPANNEIATGFATYDPVTGRFQATSPQFTLPYRISFKHSFWLRETLPDPLDPALPMGSWFGGIVNCTVGDIDDDNAVTASDYGIWQVQNGSFVPEGTGADLDGDGAVTPSDYGLWQINNGAFGDD